VAQASAIEIGSLTDCWLVAAEQLRIDTSQVDTLGMLLRDRVLRISAAPSQRADRPVRFFPSDVTLQFAHRQLTLPKVEGQWNVDGQKVQLRLAWESPDKNRPGVFAVARNQERAASQIVWDLATGAGELPCALGNALVPGLARLGNDCQFAGAIQVTQSGTETTGTLTGTLHRVDLDALVTEQFPHRLSGLADVHVEQAVLTAGRLASVRGNLRATMGSLSESLLAAAEEHLELQPTRRDGGTGAIIPFDELGLRFQLDGNRLQLAGIADRINENVAARDAAGPLATVPPNHSTPAVNLLRTLLPDNQYQVPATRQTELLVGLLPVPDLVPVRTAALPKHTPTRLRTSGQPDAAPVLRQPMLR
jgi:hypothetical protein